MYAEQSVGQRARSEPQIETRRDGRRGSAQNEEGEPVVLAPYNHMQMWWADEIKRSDMTIRAATKSNQRATRKTKCGGTHGEATLGSNGGQVFITRLDSV